MDWCGSVMDWGSSVMNWGCSVMDSVISVMLWGVMNGCSSVMNSGIGVMDWCDSSLMLSDSKLMGVSTDITKVVNRSTRVVHIMMNWSTCVMRLVVNRGTRVVNRNSGMMHLVLSC